MMLGFRDTGFVSATHRNPTFSSAVSGVAWLRALARYPSQKVGEHRNDPPRETRSPSTGSRSGAPYGTYHDDVHSHTLPAMSVSPDGAAPNAPTGEVPR